MDDDELVAYCPDCNVSLSSVRSATTTAERHAQQHARVTGHVVHIVRRFDWSVLWSVAGEPSLPLW